MGNKFGDFGYSPLNRGCPLNTGFTVHNPVKTGAPNDNFRKNICSEDDLRTRIFEKFVVKFLAWLPLLGFSNIKKMVYLPIFNGFLP